MGFGAASATYFSKESLESQWSNCLEGRFVFVGKGRQKIFLETDFCH